jgi:hypothetical protein
MNAAREYLVDQLVITARALATRSIGYEVASLPFCKVCFMSGLNGHPIQHLPSCVVGQVLRAIEELGARGCMSADQVRAKEAQFVATHMVLPRGLHTMVKEIEFFRSQNGHIDEWGKAWRPVVASSIEDAREIGYRMSECDERPATSWDHGDVASSMSTTREQQP